ALRGNDPLVAPACLLGAGRAWTRAHLRAYPRRPCRGGDRRGPRSQPLRDDRERRPAWRGRARDEGVSGRPVGDALPRHPLRRERDLPHRLRRRLPFPLRRRSGGGAQRREHARRLHGRRARARGGRGARRRDRGAADPRRGVATRVSDNGERLERYAGLAVRVGAHVQPGQEVFVHGLVEHAELIRALTRQSYRAGAAYVNVRYEDQHIRRAMIELGPDEALTYSPEWLNTWAQTMAGNAQLGTSGNPEPELLADLDGERVGRAMPLEAGESARRAHGEHRVNWSGVGAPTQGWAREVLGEPDVEQLWELVAFCFRLDEPDPVAAWREHLDRLDARAAALTERRADALRYRGPGTDFTVGL